MDGHRDSKKVQVYSVGLRLFQRCYILYVKVFTFCASSFRQQVVVQYGNFFARSVFEHCVSDMGIHYFLQRAQGVLGADRHLCLQMLIHKSLMFTASHLICDRFSALRAGFSTSSLRCTF